jgi:hypothetical protein
MGRGEFDNCQCSPLGFGLLGVGASLLVSLSFFEAKAGNVQLDAHGVVDQAVDGRGGRHGIFENLSPLENTRLQLNNTLPRSYRSKFETGTQLVLMGWGTCGSFPACQKEQE